jgi:hypothetical protein
MSRRARGGFSLIRQLSADLIVYPHQSNEIPAQLQICPKVLFPLVEARS